MAFLGIYSFIIIFGTVTGLYFIVKYLMLKKYSKFLTSLLISAFVIIVMTIIAWCCITYSTPESFRAGVKLILQNDTIMNKIGNYESYTYKATALPNKNDNPAKFNVEIKGSKGKLYVSCRVFKASSGEWQIVAIKVDSLE